MTAVYRNKLTARRRRAGALIATLTLAASTFNVSAALAEEMDDPFLSIEQTLTEVEPDTEVIDNDDSESDSESLEAADNESASPIQEASVAEASEDWSEAWDQCRWTKFGTNEGGVDTWDWPQCPRLVNDPERGWRKITSADYNGNLRPVDFIVTVPTRARLYEPVTATVEFLNGKPANAVVTFWWKEMMCGMYGGYVSGWQDTGSSDTLPHSNGGYCNEVQAIVTVNAPGYLETRVFSHPIAASTFNRSGFARVGYATISVPKGQTPAPGVTLTASVTGTDPTPTEVKYEWYRTSAKSPGVYPDIYGQNRDILEKTPIATGPNYTLKAVDAGKAITVKVSVTKGEHPSGYPDGPVFWDWVTSVPVLVDNGFSVAPVTRLAGVGRQETAVEIAGRLFPDATTAFAAFDRDFPDALAAAAAAGMQDAPVLLVGSTVPNSQVVLDYLQSSNITKVYIAGGTARIPQDVLNAIAGKVGGANNVTRLAGVGRQETAVEIAARLFPDATTAFVAFDRDFPDALAAAAAAGMQDAPVLLVGSTVASSQVVLDYLEASNITQVYISGGTARIPQEVLNAISLAVG